MQSKLRTHPKVILAPGVQHDTEGHGASLATGLPTGKTVANKITSEQ